MKIKLHEISIAELTNGYVDNNESGVRGYGGKLDIRPPYQREFVYDDAQRNAVIETIFKGFPLNAMYWAVRDDGNYEIIDGQQRTCWREPACRPPERYGQGRQGCVSCPLKPNIQLILTHV